MDSTDGVASASSSTSKNDVDASTSSYVILVLYSRQEYSFVVKYYLSVLF